MWMEVCSSIGENEGPPITGYGRKTAGMIRRLGHVIGNPDRCISTGTVFSKVSHGHKNEAKGGAGVRQTDVISLGLARCQLLIPLSKK